MLLRPEMTDRHIDRLKGISETEQSIMERLLQMPPEQHKAAPKPTGSKALAQQRRREREREAAKKADQAVPLGAR